MNSKGMDIEGDEVKSWFNKKNISIIDTVVGNKSVYNRFSAINIISKVKKFIR